MGKLVREDIVVMSFPFSDLSTSKRRPASVLVDLAGDDIMLCQITSRAVRDGMAISIDTADVINEALNTPGNARPNRLFAADESLVLYSLGKLKADKFGKIITSIVAMFQN